MALRPVDFRGALTADLPRGRVEDRDGRRLVALPAEILTAMLELASEQNCEVLAKKLAPSTTSWARSVLEQTDDASPEEVGYAVSAALAAHGLGLVRFERWGEALLLRWSQAPATGKKWEAFAMTLLSAMLSDLMELTVFAAIVGRDDDSLRVLFSGPDVCAEVRTWCDHGASLGDVLTKLTTLSAEA